MMNTSKPKTRIVVRLVSIFLMVSLTFGFFNVMAYTLITQMMAITA
jgi:hypothetical protein